MDLDLMLAKQPDFQYEKPKRGFYAFQYHFKPVYAALQPQTRRYFVCNKPNHILQDCWYNPAYQQP